LQAVTVGLCEQLSFPAVLIDDSIFVICSLLMMTAIRPVK